MSSPAFRVRGKLCGRLRFTDGQKISEIDFENLLSGRNFSGDKIVALDGRQIMKRDFNQLFGALCRQKLAGRLSKDNGYEIDYAKNGECRR